MSDVYGDSPTHADTLDRAVLDEASRSLLTVVKKELNTPKAAVVALR